MNKETRGILNDTVDALKGHVLWVVIRPLSIKVMRAVLLSTRKSGKSLTFLLKDLEGEK